MSTPGYIFFAEFAKGNVFKILTDSFRCSTFTRVHMTINQDGIFIQDNDEGRTILYDCAFPRENFKTFNCTKEKKISFVVTQSQKQLKNVKKKDSVTLFIEDESSPHHGHIGVSIRPESSSSSLRFETNYFVYDDEPDYIPIGIPDSAGYDHPMTIDASDFQKIKRLTSSCNKIIIKIQGNNYLLFSSGEAEILPSQLGFGNLNPANPHFENKYNAKNLNMIIKLPGLCSSMSFYAPKEEGYPLRVKMNAGQNNTLLGTVQVYIKDAKSIEADHIEPPIIAPVKGRGKGKK